MHDWYGLGMGPGLQNGKKNRTISLYQVAWIYPTHNYLILHKIMHIVFYFEIHGQFHFLSSANSAYYPVYGTTDD